MSMNLLEIVREARGRLGQPIPASVAGNADPSIIQSLGLLNEFLEDLVLRKYWQSNTREATFASVAAASQGELDTLFPYGFEGIIPNTLYNRSTKLQVTGGLSPDNWQARQAMNMAGPIPSFRLRNNQLLFSPTPTAGETYACEYFSSYFVYNAADAVYRKYWLKDTDVCVLGESLPIAYLKWAWQKAKGLDYAEDFRKYETMVETKGIRDVSSAPIDMSDGSGNFSPGIFVTPGSWNQ